MQTEIPAGTKVKVAVTQKGVTTYQDAEVLAHMDGLVHVNMNGEAVTVDPSQVVTGETTANATQPVPGSAITVDDLLARVEALHSHVFSLNARIDALELRIATLEKPIDAPAPGATQAVATMEMPAAQIPSTDEASMAAVVSGDPLREVN